MLLLEPQPARVRAKARGTRVLQIADSHKARTTANIHQPPETRNLPTPNLAGSGDPFVNTCAGHSNMRFVGRCRESGRTLSRRRRLLKAHASQGNKLPVFRCRAAVWASRREPYQATRCSNHPDGNFLSRQRAPLCGRECGFALQKADSLREGSTHTRSFSTIAGNPWRF